MTDALLETNLGLPNKRSGKVRDLYDVALDDGGEALLIVRHRSHQRLPTW